MPRLYEYFGLINNNSKTLTMVDVDELNDELVAMLAHGMENLVGVLGVVCGRLDELKH